MNSCWLSYGDAKDELYQGSMRINSHWFWLFVRIFVWDSWQIFLTNWLKHDVRNTKVFASRNCPDLNEARWKSDVRFGFELFALFAILLSIIIFSLLNILTSSVVHQFVSEIWPFSNHKIWQNESPSANPTHFDQSQKSSD
jgi:hypothetical protein